MMSFAPGFSTIKLIHQFTQCDKLRWWWLELLSCLQELEIPLPSSQPGYFMSILLRILLKVESQGVLRLQTPNSVLCSCLSLLTLLTFLVDLATDSLPKGKGHGP